MTEKKEGFKPINSMWTEKYRPSKLDDIVGEFKDIIKNYLKEPSSIPHFLFYSKTPGSGKTTLSKAIINELGCDFLIINSSDDRKIEVIRDKVKQFALTQSSKAGLRRVVFLDEADGMLKTSQDALRNIMETYAKNVFFILTCNNIHKIIEPVQSRCVCIEFTAPDKEQVYKYLKSICEKEQLIYTEEGLNKLININYPSIRDCVLVLQHLYTQNKQITIENVEEENKEFSSFWDMIVQKDWKTVKQKVFENNVDCRELNNYFWQKSVDTDNIKGIQLTCRNERDMAFGADPSIIFVSSLLEMVK
jgi:replication factor C small subunit